MGTPKRIAVEATPFYLMEHEQEGFRLKIKSKDIETLDHLKLTGFDLIPEGSVIVDAGAGIGHVAKKMGELLRQNQRKGTILLLDASTTRLLEARSGFTQSDSIQYQFVECNLEKIPLLENSADYVFSRFVFEYLPKPQEAFDELVRILKPGGKLVIGDLDYNCLTHYPMEAELEKQLFEIVSLLKANNVFDPYMGRKIYSLFHGADLSQIQVHFSAHHLFYGDLESSDLYNWTAKLEQLTRLQHKGSLKLSFDIESFKQRFLKFLGSKERFTYTPLILVEGVKKT